MIEQIKYHPRFKKQCIRLNKSGAKAKKAVKKAFDILFLFKTSKKKFNCIGSLSHHGELRVKSCIKYRLGNGYRLIVSIKKHVLFVLFIGSHDQCSQWLEINRGADHFCFSIKETIVRKNSTDEPRQIPNTNDSESVLFYPIKDTILRQVFKGLCK
ncbi:MAG: hypothetical protein L3J69_00965 [Desulfobacula sp.]|nr:hypothetical protein [Desulfobacula sp.]